ncbi:MAG: SHOCT domain-containing protein [Bacteroidales bacterium]|nr:SHOCT domain-containing protein [Bacteroidales bacterium]
MMGGMGSWWIIGVIVLIAIIWPLAQRFNRNNSATREPQKLALDILKERYARGEIDKQEFEERKMDL